MTEPIHFGFITLTYPNNVLANLRFSWADSHRVRELVAVGAAERIVFDELNAMEPVRIYRKGLSAETPGASYGEYLQELRDGEIRSPRVRAREPLALLASDFVGAVDKGSRPLADVVEGATVVRVLDAVQCSMRRGGAPVDLFGPTPPASLVASVARRAV